MRLLNVFIALVFLMPIIGCQQQSSPRMDNTQYLADIESWHQKRIADLKSDTGWLNLVGLFWLKQGKNTFGSGPQNDIVFPGQAPKRIGTFYLKNGHVTVKIRSGVNVYYQEKNVTTLTLTPDTESNKTTLKLGSLRWFIIKRGDAFGVRLRDLDSPLISDFPGVERFPVDQNWRLTATFEPYDPPKSIPIPTVLGTTIHEPSPGALAFKIHGKTYKLDTLDDDGGYWVIFGDETNGEETYGGGRFLVIDKPDSLGNLTIDFNKAYDPPCAFTRFATCPLPPAQNRLAVKIEAGEEAYHGPGGH